MSGLVLRVTPRHGRGVEYHRFDASGLSIGRALDNGVILGDPYVGAHQFRIAEEGGQLRLTVLDGTNPVQLNGRRLGERETSIVPGDEFTVGLSQLTVLREDTPVAATRVLSTTLWQRIGRWRPVLALVLLGATCATSTWLEFLDTVTTIDWAELTAGSLFLGMMVLAWAGLWTLAGRLLRHQPHFSSHLAVSAIVVLLVMAVSGGVDYAGYASGFSGGTGLARWALNSALMVLLLQANLRLATQFRRPVLIALLVVYVPLGLFGALQLVQREEFERQIDADTLLRPPFAKWRDGLHYDAYEEGLEALFDEVRAD